MKILIINGSSVPLYEQIKNAIKENIMEGILSEGEQLPSVRELSRDLKVSILTVKKAYDELEKEGFITVRQGLGSFVSSDNSGLYKEEKQKEMEGHLTSAAEIAALLELEKDEVIELFRFLLEGGNTDEQD